MFDELLNKMRENISTVRSLIQANEELRNKLFGHEDTFKNSTNESLDLGSLRAIFPNVHDWIIYDHCSVITRLYAIYENFVESLITDWILKLPSLYSCYSNLPAEIRGTHQIGVANLLLELKKKKTRYEHLSIEQIIKGLYLGITATENKYDLIADAFLFHDQNLRKDALEKLFADVGISKAWNWVEQHRNVKFFVEETLANQNTAEVELKKLIDYRNEAAHGTVIDDVLRAKRLLDLCDFIEVLCQALSELVTYYVIERQKSIGQVKDIGKMTEWYQKPKAGVARIIEANLSIGDTVFLVDKNKSYCQMVKIESMRLDDISYDRIFITVEREVGLQFDQNARKNVNIYINISEI